MRPVADGFPVNGKLDPRLPVGAIWSVDEPVIWDALRPCMDVASRIFVASLGLPFWDAMLDAQPGTHLWQEKMGYREGLKDQPYKAVDRDPKDQGEPKVLKALFNSYARYITFSFFPVPDDVNSKPGMSVSMLGISDHRALRTVANILTAAVSKRERRKKKKK